MWSHSYSGIFQNYITLSSNYNIVGCKHRASEGVFEGVFYIGGRRFVCQIIEPVTLARCAFIFALWNIALGGYLDTRRNIWNIYGTTYGLKYTYICDRAFITHPYDIKF